MQSAWESRGKKLHTRTLELTTYDYDAQRIIVEGFLIDDRFQDSHSILGPVFPAGVMHHMVMRLLVNCSNFMIEDIDAELKYVPQDVCNETANCLALIKGTTITRGFTSKVKKLAGGNRGCIHLVELLLAMAPAVFQGVRSHQSRTPSPADADLEKFVSQSLLNTCYIWREDGPSMEKVRKRLKK
jgi:hypothetical protein